MTWVLIFWYKVWNYWPERYGKFQSEIPCTSGAICEKPQGGGPLGPSPAGRGLLLFHIRYINGRITYGRSYVVKIKVKLQKGEGHLFAILPDLRPPPLLVNWWGIKVQITCQKVWHILFVRSNPFPSSHVSGGRHQAMEKKKNVIFLRETRTFTGNFIVSLGYWFVWKSNNHLFSCQMAFWLDG